MSGTRIEDWFDDGQEFEDALVVAIENTTGGRSVDFLIELKEKWDKFGMNAWMSEGQYDWLCRLAGIDE